MATELILIMQDQEIRRAFGLRLKELRKQKSWTQKKLANMIDIRFAQLNKYECGMHIPPIEKLILLSTVLRVTLDYLVMGDQNNIRPLHNLRLMERLKELELFDDEDQDAIIKMIDAMIVKRRVEGAMLPIDKQTAAH